MDHDDRNKEISLKLIRSFMRFKRLHHFGEDDYKRKDSNHIRHSEMSLIFAIRDAEKSYPDGINVKDLSNFLHVKPPSIIPLINSLEKKDMVERSIDRNDRRIIRIRLKDAGYEIIEKSKNHFLARMQGLVDYLGPEKSEQLSDLLQEVYNYVAQLDKCGPARQEKKKPDIDR
ncbi:MAG TPA: MarR family winged helix-turn-helix transcriptional regulator [Clostridia bacterium]|nr:MarR family winged helix-turn-helix transcriptional regulator [Clostridia bacterium]